MTTKVRVTSGNPETLKMEKTNLVKIMGRWTKVVLLLGLSLVGMSFTTDDTSNVQDTISENTVTVQPADSSLSITMLSGNRRIVIVNKNAFTATVSIDDMDVNTWVNSLMAYSYKRLNGKSVTMADKMMDNNFVVAEKRNGKMAVALAKTIKAEIEAADAATNELFAVNITAPLFSKSVNEQAKATDAQLDEKMYEDAELMKQAAQYSKTINTIEADTDMDMMVNASALKNFLPENAVDADAEMDQMIQRVNIKKITPAAAQQADKYMDGLLQNKE